MKNKLYIAETAFSHEGDSKFLLKVNSQLHKSSINAVKYQILLNKADILSENHSLFNDIDKYMIKKDEWLDVIKDAKSKSILTIGTLLCYDSINFCEEHHQLFDYIEIHSSCLTDINFVEECSKLSQKKSLGLIISISGYEITEIDYVIKIVKGITTQNVILMHGFQNYPTNIKDINLNKIKYLQNKYKLDVGYADHTKYDSPLKTSLVSNALNYFTNIVEVHVVLTKGEERLDYITAIDPKDYREIIDHADLMSRSIGNLKFELSEAEIKYGLNFRKVPVTSVNAYKGEPLNYKNIKFKRVNNPNSYFLGDKEKFTNKKFKKNVNKEKQILLEDLL